MHDLQGLRQTKPTGHTVGFLRIPGGLGREGNLPGPNERVIRREVPDPFLEAIQAARWMAANDALAFVPPYWDRVWPGDRRLCRDSAQIQLLGVRGAGGASGTVCRNNAVDEGRFSSFDHLPGDGVG